MNICLFVGTVVKDPEVIEFNNTKKVQIILETISKRYSYNHGEVEIKNYPLLEIWDSAADFVLKNVKIGSKMWVNCSYISDKNGRFRINDFKII